MPPVKFIVLVETNNLVDAHLFRTMLEEAGIPAVVQQSNLWSPDNTRMPAVLQYRLLVAEAEAEHARLLLADYCRQLDAGELLQPEAVDENEEPSYRSGIGRVRRVGMVMLAVVLIVLLGLAGYYFLMPHFALMPTAVRHA